MIKYLNWLLLITTTFIAFISLNFGSSDVSLFQALIDALNGQQTDASLIVIEIRLPRTLLAILVGASLGLSGAALQGLLRNPLVEPGLIGASQGAALGAATVFYYGFFSTLGVFATAAAGLIGAMLALMLMLLLSGSGQSSVIILAGLAISSIAGALLALVLNYAPNPFAMQELVFWLLGSVAHRSLNSVFLMLFSFFIGLLIIWQQRQVLAALSLGELVAQSMGINVSQASLKIIFATAVLVGTSVSIAGNIAFVGLLIPHIFRPLVNYNAEKLLIPSALGGGALVCMADLFVRMLPIGNELKLGVLTTILGVPFFIWLVIKERKKWL